MRLCVLVARISIETGSVESVCIICRMDVVTQLKEVLKALLIYHFLLSFMLTICNGCVGSDSKARFRRRTSHDSNRMLIRENKGFFSFAFDSVHVKNGV